MIKLDEYDKKILEILLSNSREQVSTIGKRIRLRRENVNYKINRMIKEGLIKEFNTILNEKKLRLTHYVVYTELVNLGEKSEENILEYLKENKYTSWVGTSAGKWSLIFDVVIPEKIELEKVLNNFLSKFGKYVDNYSVLRFNKGDYYGEKILGIVRKDTTKKNQEETSLNDIDFKILSLLNKNSRINLVEISEKVGLTPNGVNNRIKNLERKEIILGYTISLDWKKLDYEWYGFQLKLIKFGEGIDKKFIEFFNQHKKIIFYYKYIGDSWDYDIGVIVKNSNELREFINEFRNKFSSVAKINDIFLTLEETTGYKLPKAVFE